MSEYAGKVRKIRERFLGSFEQRLDGIEQARADVAAGDTEAMKTLHLRLHDFCGSAAMLGLEDIAQESRRSLDAIERTEIKDATERSQMLSGVHQSIFLIREMKRDAEGTE